MRGAASGGFESHNHFVCPVRSQEYRARFTVTTAYTDLPGQPILADSTQ